MRWRGRRQSSNIEDRRGGGFSPGRGMRIPIRAGGGGGIGFIIIVLVLWFGFGINPLQLLGEGGTGTGPASGPGVEGTTGETDDFVATVLADTEDVWSARFEESGETYPAPTLVLFESQVQSACGIAGAATGPFYCPGDQKLYIDLGFFQQLRQQLNSPGDFAQAYVIAHEVGHHIQNLTGVLSEFNEARQQMGTSEANELSVRVELQADCYAGIWAHDTQAAGYVEAGDIDEALNAATQIGDDTLQERSQGTVMPDSFTHGTSEQRSEWFYRGFETGDIGACDTFGADF
jgi:predicted metalloprotease